MRFQYVFVVIAIVLGTNTAKSQENLEQLSVPNSPASSILGSQASTILSPKSYEALEAALYSNFMNSGSPVIPNDFALEFTPYWASDHGLSVSEYLYPTAGMQFVRNSSFSVASTRNFLLGDSSKTNALSFGYRTTFYFGQDKKRESVNDFLKTFDEKSKLYSSVLASALQYYSSSETKKELLDSLIIDINRNSEKNGLEFETTKMVIGLIESEFDSLPEINKNSPNHEKSYLTKITNALDDFESFDIETKKTKLHALIEEKKGWSLDIAYANLINFPTNDFELSYVPKQSFWFAPTYTFGSFESDNEKAKTRKKDGKKYDFKRNKMKIKLSGVMRYEWYNKLFYNNYFSAATLTQDNFDFGGSISFRLDDFSFQFELVGKISPYSNGPKSYSYNSDVQYLGAINYQLSDQILLSYTMGNKFESVFNINGTLVSQLSVNFGFGSSSHDDLDFKKYR